MIVDEFEMSSHESEKISALWFGHTHTVYVARVTLYEKSAAHYENSPVYYEKSPK